MYADEYSDKESEYEDRSPDESNTITKKSLSTVGFRSASDNTSARPLALRATQSLTGAEGRGAARGVRRAEGRPLCPCGCLLRAAAAPSFRTRDQNTLALHVVPPDALTHHGHAHEPDQIAMFWKKDCRMFLWKGKAKTKTNPDAPLM